MSSFDLVGYALVRRGGSWSGGVVYGELQSQSWSGGVVYGALESQSWSGGVVYGSLTAQSWSGGATVSSIPYIFPGPFSGGGPAFGFFCKVPSLPASNMTLLDWNLGAAGYSRILLDNTGSVVWQAANGSLGISVNYQINPSTKITTGQWFWVAGSSSEDGGHINFHGRVHQSGSLIGDNNPGGPNLGGDVSYSAQWGIGVSVSSSFLNFPNSPGYEMSKIRYDPQGSPNNGVTLYGPITSDWSSGVAYYNARQSVGPAATLIDGSGTYTAPAGAQGLTINLDGPYP